MVTRRPNSDKTRLQKLNCPFHCIWIMSHCVQNKTWDWEIIKSKTVLFFPKYCGSLINFLSNRKKESKDIVQEFLWVVNMIWNQITCWNFKHKSSIFILLLYWNLYIPVYIVYSVYFYFPSFFLSTYFFFN